MIVAIQQPEHLPWMGFFNKMTQCDLFVFLDNVQYKKRYFENRNKVKTKDGIKWLTVPVQTKGKYMQKIKEVLIDNVSPWNRKYMGLLENSLKKTEFWPDLKEITCPVMERNFEKLVELNIALINSLKDYLRINTKTIFASSLGVDHFSGSDIILEICSKTKAAVYISGADGRNYLKLQEFKDRKIKVLYHDFEHPKYRQQNGDFVANLSTIDLISNCGPGSANLIESCYKVPI